MRCLYCKNRECNQYQATKPLQDQTYHCKVGGTDPKNCMFFDLIPDVIDVEYKEVKNETNQK